MNTGMNTDMDTGVDTARGGGAKERQPQGKQRADEHANTAEGNTAGGKTVEGNVAYKKEMDTDKARDEATASNTVTTISEQGAKACRRRRRRRCWTTRARGNKHRFALKTMLAVVPPLLLPALLWQMLAVEAVFTPRTRAELQGDGGAEKGVFGCVGECGVSPLENAGTASSYCSQGAWNSGTGICANANSGVPNGQGTGTYGVIGSWDVSGVHSMAKTNLPILVLFSLNFSMNL
eukprot:g2232.t1